MRIKTLKIIGTAVLYTLVAIAMAAMAPACEALVLWICGG